MRIVVHSLALLVATSPALAAKCKLKNTEEGLRQTNAVKVHFKGSTRIDFAFAAGAEDEYRLFLHYLRDFSGEFRVNADTEMRLSLDNGAMLRIFPESDKGTKRMIVPLITNSKRLRVYYDLAERQLRQLMESEVVRVEIDYLDKNGALATESREVVEKRRRGIRHIAGCILEETSGSYRELPGGLPPS